MQNFQHDSVKLDQSVLNSLSDLRQSMWKDISSIISDHKIYFERIKQERDKQFRSIAEHNQSLINKMRRLEGIIEGKEIEICGLRRQLQSFVSGNVLCTSCSQYAVEHDNIRDDCRYFRSTFLPRISRHEAQLRKRNRNEASISSSSVEPGSTKRSTIDMKQTLKRHCTDPFARISSRLFDPQEKEPETKQSQQQQRSCNSWTPPPSPPPNVKQSQMPDSNNSPTGNKGASNETELTKQQQAVPEPGNSDGGGGNNDSLPRNLLRLSSFSPPSKVYDASLAIQNAVNHSDLDYLEATLLGSLMTTTSHEAPVWDTTNTPGDQTSPSLTLSGNGSASRSEEQPFFRVRTRNTIIRTTNVSNGRDRNGTTRRSLRQHKPTCRHFGVTRTKGDDKRKRKTEPPSTNENPDETEADLTLPSDFLESDVSVAVPVVGSTCQQGKSLVTTGTVTDKLPSIGHSPTHNTFKHPTKRAPRLTAKNMPQSIASSQSPGIETHEAQPAVTSEDESRTVGQLPIENKENLKNEFNIKSDEPYENKADSSAGDSSSTSKTAFAESIGLIERRPTNLANAENVMEKLTARIYQRAHRRVHSHGPPSTPKGFWDLHLSESTQASSESKSSSNDKEPVKTLRSDSYRRRRPLLFPAHKPVSYTPPAPIS